MVKSIEEYTAEVSRSYDNSRNALQNRINAIAGDLAQTQKQINQNYDTQQSNLENQRNWASESASLAASNNGGSFGGATEIANKKYYEQAFVPAQTQLNTSRSQALENAQSQANSNRMTLESQLSSMNDEIAKLGIQRYYDELEREREEAYRQQQLALQRQQIAAQNAYQQYLNRSQNNQTYKNWDFGDGYSVQQGIDGTAKYIKNGNNISAMEFLLGTGGNKGVNWNLWNDIWNNGVSTTGVGADTVQAISGARGLDRITNSANSKYSYLLGV